MQQKGADKPVGLPIGEAAPEPVRRHLGDKRAIAESGVHKIVLALDAPDAVPDVADILLGEDLGANEGRILLRVDNLVKRTRATDRAGGKVGVAFRAGK